MTALSVADFAPFLEAVHGHPPFPWQARLLSRVADEGWPATLDLPTASGKTTALDVAVFHLALEAARPPAERTAPRRVAFVVDRRVVVDQAYTHARRLAEALSAPAHPVVAAVAQRLLSLSDTGVPLAPVVLRGAMMRDESWARSADQPTVLVSTVDQVGSRLLFRGYGVSEGMRPVHAGLLGQDTLFLLDEVHLSQPFAQTLGQLGGSPDAPGLRARAGAPLPARWGAVALSATPRGEAAGFGLSAEDRAHPRLSERLTAAKLASLKKVSVPKDSPHPVQAFGRLAAELAWKHQRAHRPQVLGLLLNRVDSARAAARWLLEAHGSEAEVVLLTGRMRPLDRDDLLAHREAGGPTLLQRLMDREVRRPEDPPLLLVSTQAIEAGADFDLDALVTECASLDALKQRFGRVDRRGRVKTTRSLILRRSGDGKDDPIYGPALDATWKLLEEVGGTVDFGPEGLEDALAGQEVSGCLPPTAEAPHLRRADLEAWSRTRPAPTADPEPALFLHGTQEVRPEVQVVWRTEVAPLTGDSPDRVAAQLPAMVAALEACPPSTLEAVSLPLGAVRAWLARTPSPEVADVEGRSADPGDASRPGGHRALRWRGEDSALVAARELRPGDTVVVPPAYGGLWQGNWDPQAGPEGQAPVLDWGDRAQWRHRRRASLRLAPPALATWAPPGMLAPPRPTEDPVADQASLTDWLKGLRDDAALPDWVRAAAALLADRRKVIPLGAHPVLQASAPPERAAVPWAADLVSDEATSAHTGGAVALEAHLEAVGAEAGRLAASLGLSQALTADVALAGRLHDLGKADPRFQQMLYGGSEAAFRIAGVHLAKSGLPAGDRAARLAARAGAGWPPGLRHELTSVALAEASGLLEEAHDRELVAHLIAAHHGHARPLPPPVADPVPVEVAWTFGGRPVTGSTDHGLWSLGGPVPGRFERLTDRYGWYGLAWLETLVRLADQRVSAIQAGEAA